MMSKYYKKLTRHQWVMAILSVVSIILIILDFAAVISIDVPTSKWFWINSAIVIYFAIDYFKRLHQASDRKAFVKNNIYDLLSIIPIGFLFVGLNMFNMVSLVSDLRLLRLIRLAGLMGKLKEIFHTNGLMYVVFFTITFLLVGAEAFAITEHVSLDTAFWWVLSTASTVGYDAIFGKTIPPHSIVAKFVTLVMMLLGIGIVGMLTSSITSYLVRRTNGANTSQNHDNIELILKKLDKLEQQNQTLAEQNKQLAAEIQEIKDKSNEHEFSKLKDWLEQRKDKIDD
ncbi:MULTISPECIES: ion transporter [Lactobacillus]|uniref:Ion transporter n=1 Tax=Lactobacillus xujianguonis TaxID=2495899 RepID=A0A437SWV3_9LACO|nr:MULTISPECIES: ion transporter [Lactobacillus]RVU71405.1 ion transporter [Lactobacillus xujianguonis]RVU76934.1 ion transporter [Lactobacillus xujianguonis]